MTKRQNEKRDALLSAVIRLVSRNGLENLTTKSVEQESGVSERYIFLYFGNKDGLLTEVFDSLDSELFTAFNDAFTKALAEEPRKEQCLKKAWCYVWDFLTSDRDKTRFYIRYYYSEQFEKLSRKSHSQYTADFVKFISPLFNTKSNAADCLRYIFTSLLSAALISSRSSEEENRRFCDRTFRFLYDSMKNHFA